MTTRTSIEKLIADEANSMTGSVNTILREIRGVGVHVDIEASTITSIMTRSMEKGLGRAGSSTDITTAFNTFKTAFIREMAESLQALTPNRGLTSSQMQTLLRRLEDSMSNHFTTIGQHISTGWVAGDTAIQAARTGGATPEAIQVMTDQFREFFRHIVFGNMNMLPFLRNIGSWIGGLMIADWGLSSVRDLAEMALITVHTQDPVIISPLFFRGEPFVAGLEGINKKEGEDLGFLGIMRGKFQDAVSAIGRAIHDPFVSAYHEASLEEVRRLGISQGQRGFPNLP
jgi:hypothetical protein